MSLRIAALVKQIPAFEAMTMGPGGRLVREGLPLEMSAYCRRAVAQAVALAAEHSGEVTILTLGPLSAEACLREGIAWATDHGVPATGVLISDPACAGSDTLATARALAAALRVTGAFDLVLVGRNSVDADTGQVGPQLAELLHIPFLTTARHLTLTDRVLDVRSEHDDGWAQVRAPLPAVVSTAERLIDPCKVPEDERRAAVPADRLHTLTTHDLGPGPWGAAGSPTRVGATRVTASVRLAQQAPSLPLAEQVDVAVSVCRRGALDQIHDDPGAAPPVPASSVEGRPIGVVVEPDRPGLTRELLGHAATLGGPVTALVTESETPDDLAAWGADHIVQLTGIVLANEQDCSAATVAWAVDAEPWAILAPSTAWGREVAGRSAAALGTGLTGDAVDLEREGDELIAWKPAFGGQIVAAIHCSTRPQMATVRPGVLPRRPPRTASATHESRVAATNSVVEVLARTRDDDMDVLAEAQAVIGVGQAVDPADYPLVDQLATSLGAQVAATRKVTDQGWLPRARQLGITGRSISPRLFVSIGASGKFNHMVGVRTAGTIVVINPDPDAPAHAAADVSILGDYRDVIPLMISSLAGG